MTGSGTGAGDTGIDDRADPRRRSGADPSDARRLPPGQGAAIAVAVGIGAAVLGLVPWILTGLRLPLQNLWATEVADAAEMPLVLLPFNQYTVGLLAAVIIVGGGIAGGAARLLRPRLPRHGTALVVVGLLLVQGVAAAQTAAVVHDGLGLGRAGGTSGDPSEALVYWAGILGGAVVAILLSAGLAALLARAPAGGAVVALGAVTVLLGTWVSALLAPLLDVGADGATTFSAASAVLRWIPPVVLGVGIALTGLRTAGRVVGSVLALVLLWLGTALVVGVTYALGNRSLLRDPRELLAAGRMVAGQVLQGTGGVLTELAVAAAVGIVGAVVVRRLRPREVAAA